MTKFVSYSLTNWKQDPTPHWYSRISGEVITNPEVTKLFASGKVRHWHIETNYIPARIYMEVDN